MEEFNFGKRLKDYRKRNKMTQAELANLLGKSTSTIYGYETNQILPSYATVCQMSAIFSVEIEDLLDLVEEDLIGDGGNLETYTRFTTRWWEYKNEKE